MYEVDSSFITHNSENTWTISELWDSFESLLLGLSIAVNIEKLSLSSLGYWKIGRQRGRVTDDFIITAHDAARFD